MEIHRQRFSQVNSRLKQQRLTTAYRQPVQSETVCPIILPSESRPQPHQQPRKKQYQPTNLLPVPATRRTNTSHVRHQPLPSEPGHKHITLANLTQILHVLQTQVKLNDTETSTVMSSSTNSGAKQRVQQHLQETAVRWWKPTRSPDYPPPAPSSIHRYADSPPPPRISSSTIRRRQQQQSDNLPLLTIVSNSNQHSNISSTDDNASSTYDEPEPSIAPLSNAKHIRHEPIIMQAHGRRLHSDDRYKYRNHMNLSQQRPIHQT